MEPAAKTSLTDNGTRYAGHVLGVHTHDAGTRGIRDGDRFGQASRKGGAWPSAA